MNDNTILITGSGVVSAAGSGLAETLDSFGRLDRNAGPVTLFPTTLRNPVFEVKDVPAAYRLEGLRTVSLALMALDEALKDARLSDLSGFRVGVCIGTSVASQLNDLSFYRAYRETGNAPLTAVNRFLASNLADYIAAKTGARGPRLTVVNACSSGTDAIGVALSWLKSELCDIAIAGGADELNHIPYCGFNALGIVNPGLCAPFDRDRKGLNLGEGAGILILETRKAARKRGVSSEIALTAYGCSSDAYHLTAPSPEGVGLRAAVKSALAEAGADSGQVAFVNAHGTGTRDNDLVEGKVLKDIFGPDLVMLSTKGFTGHTLGAAGGLEAAFTVAGLRLGWVPASAGFSTRDEAIPLEPVRERTSVSGRWAVSTSLAFGGNNAVLVFDREAAA